MQHSWMNDRPEVIKPSANGVQELARWMPTGVKQLLLHTSPGQDLSGESSSILKWMDQKGLLNRPKRGTYSGQLLLSPLGKQLHKSLERRMAGMEGS